ncbi:diaminopimelate decarboxylase [Nocardiopsis sp. HNM0947]|uniref:Diaminopimelate decarboxylase n=1 Tax=Nocardiopsis coralli TaxID=2772213 RepID=A0ABR9PA71_9ACTN|nr:diaminopimelate decarboxylase [Nocardiopsis coralli]
MDFAERRAHAVEALAAEGVFDDDDHPLIGVLDRDEVGARIRELHDAFDGPGERLHTVAAKAATLVPVLRWFAEAGMGCEVASPGELAMALEAGFDPSRIVFDSPAKTPTELRHALELGANLNIDNVQELDRIDRLRTTVHGPGSTAEPGPGPASTPSTRAPSIGFRINPQTGSGGIEAMSTASHTSKFGVGLADPGAREMLVQAYAERPWLNQVHVHSGSQGMALDQIASGVAAVHDLAEEINARVGHRQVDRIDIGGGLPVNFTSEETDPTFHRYREAIEDAVPGLFDGRYTVTTEFGRSLLAKAGTIVARVEYVKHIGGRQVVITHAGAQVATRTAFAPESWPLRVSLHAPDGRFRGTTSAHDTRADGEPGSTPAPSLATDSATGPALRSDVAGPCCFSGDLLAQDVDLPAAEPGDLVAVHDTGAYYFSTPFSYNALPRPEVRGYEVGADGRVQWEPVRAAQSVGEILAESGGK